MYSVYLLIGSNEGNREQTLASAREKIDLRAGKILQCSEVYETEAWGKEGLPPHLNQAVLIQSPLEPLVLLNVLQQIELELGRKRLDKWGLRTIDIDIIYFENLILHQQQLQVPHPLLHLRRFVLVPLVEIAPDFLHPSLLKTNKELLTALKDPLKVIQYKMITF